MNKLSQRDSRWQAVKMGHTNYTIGRYGCLITALAMFAGLTPDILARRLKFTDEGYLLWESINALPEFPLKFVRRYYHSNLYEVDGVKVVQVDRSHWVAYIGDGKCIDPWFGDEVTILSRYNEITGFAAIEVKASVPEWSRPAYEWAIANELITKESAQTDEFMRMLTVLHRYDNLKKQV